MIVKKLYLSASASIKKNSKELCNKKKIIIQRQNDIWSNNIIYVSASASITIKQIFHILIVVFQSAYFRCVLFLRVFQSCLIFTHAVNIHGFENRHGWNVTTICTTFFIEKSHHIMSGIQNFRLHCYANATLQCVANSRNVIEWMAAHFDMHVMPGEILLNTSL